MLRADRRRPLRLGIAWPLTVMAVGYPLWWLLGIASFLPAVAAVVMALQLRGRQVRAPRWRSSGSPSSSGWCSRQRPSARPRQARFPTRWASDA